MIDFAADVAAIFGQEMAVDAVYTPSGGDAANIRVIPQLDDAETRFADVQLVSERGLFLVQVADVAQPGAGDTLVTGDVTYTVQGAPVRDARRLWWTVEAVPA